MTIKILLFNEKKKEKLLLSHVKSKWLGISYRRGHLHNAISLNPKVQLHCSYHHAQGNDSPNYSVRMHHRRYQSRI